MVFEAAKTPEDDNLLQRCSNEGMMNSSSTKLNYKKAAIIFFSIVLMGLIMLVNKHMTGVSTMSLETENVLGLTSQYGGAIPWKNINLVTSGYDLWKGDPFPIVPPGAKLDSGTPFLDPGLKKPVFALSYRKRKLSSDKRHTNPDGYHATVDAGCSTIFTTKSIRDEYEYKTDQSKKASLTGFVEANVKFPPAAKVGGSAPGAPSLGLGNKYFARAGGTLSQQWRDIQSGNMLMDQQMYRSEATCSSYVVSYSFADPPEVHPLFKDAVDKLGQSCSTWGSACWYYRLFEDFGTHFMTSIRMGARYGSSMFVDVSAISEMEKTAHGLGFTLEASLGSVSKATVSGGSANGGIKAVHKWMEAKLPLLSPEEKIAGETLSKMFVKQSTKSIVGVPLFEDGVAAWSLDVDESPVPIQWKYDIICKHPYLYKQKNKFTRCVELLDSYCTYLKSKNSFLKDCEAAKERECYNDLDCASRESVCREWKCVAAPKCVVTVYTDQHYDGESYEFPAFTRVNYKYGKILDLRNGNYDDKISSFKMSSGCERVELADDDGNCGFATGINRQSLSGLFVPWGSRWNGRYFESANHLRKDLNNDVCQIKAWAKPVPRGMGWIDLSGKSASQHSGSNADKAIDGVVESNYEWGSCTHTDHNVLNPWWQVDLGQTYNIKAVQVTNRQGNYERLNPFEIWTNSIHRCASNLWLGRGETKEFPCRGRGSIIKIQLPRKGTLTLCEVAVQTETQGNQSPTPPTVQTVSRVPTYNHPWFGPIPLPTTHPTPRPTPRPPPYSYYHPWGYGPNGKRRLNEYMPADATYTGNLDGGTQERRLSTNGYVKNIGKAMYGYNHFFGAPSSSSHAGTDPGFVHRPLWKASYLRGTTAQTTTFSKIPRPTLQELGRAPFESAAGMYLFGYATRGGIVRPMVRAKADCLKTNDCTGITCNQEGCTLRAGLELQKSPRAENSFWRTDKEIVKWEDPFEERDGIALDSYTRWGGGTRYDIPGGKKQCLRDPQCNGITCNTEITHHDLVCTLRRGPGTQPSSHEKTYFLKKKKTRRLAALRTEAPEDTSSMFLHGPQRRLAAALRVPDGWKVTMSTRTICDKNFNTREIKSQYDYKKEESLAVSPAGASTENPREINPQAQKAAAFLGMITGNPSGAVGKGPGGSTGARVDIQWFSFGGSYESKDFNKANSMYKKIMYKTTAECLEYIAEIPDLKNNPPPVDDSFKFLVDAAAAEEDFHTLFDMYGLHFPTKVFFGARYGFSQLIDEAKWSTLAMGKNRWNVNARVSLSIMKKKMKDSPIKAEIAGQVGYDESNFQHEFQNFSSFFEDTKEFSLGRRMPNEGGVQEWYKHVTDEPMPFRYALESICEHPAFSDKKPDCSTHSESYCEKHLARGDIGVTCDPVEHVECTWDMDCLPHHKCTPEGKCVALPTCEVRFYAKNGMEELTRTFGPVYYSDGPGGENGGIVFPSRGKVNSVWASKGCDQVILMDGDWGKCLEKRSSNKIMGKRTNTYNIDNLKYDLQSDICQVKLLALREWTDVPGAQASEHTSTNSMPDHIPGLDPHPLWR